MDIRKLGANNASLAGFSLDDAIAKLLDMGFYTIELLAWEGAVHSQGELAGYGFDDMSPAERDRLRAAVEPFGHVATHLPFVEMPLFTYNRPLAAFVKEQFKVGIEGTGFLGGETATLHVWPRAQRDVHEYWSDMVDTFRELADHGARWDVKVAIETMFPRSIDEFVGLIADVDRPNFGANVDVGHLTGCTDVRATAADRGTPAAEQRYMECLLRLLGRLGDKLFHLHLHDVRREDWRDHRATGRGFLDFDAIMAKLVEMGYPHLLTFELEEPDVVPALAESKRFIEAAIARVGTPAGK